jgi:hypothetical protein
LHSRLAFGRVELSVRRVSLSRRFGLNPMKFQEFRSMPCGENSVILPEDGMVSRRAHS